MTQDPGPLSVDSNFLSFFVEPEVLINCILTIVILLCTLTLSPHRELNPPHVSNPYFERKLSCPEMRHLKQEGPGEPSIFSPSVSGSTLLVNFSFFGTSSSCLGTPCGSNTRHGFFL